MTSKTGSRQSDQQLDPASRTGAGSRAPEPTIRTLPSGGRQLTLFTNHLTPNGLKVSIYLEELRILHPTLDYNINHIDMSRGIHREASFVQRNPTGRLPLLVDHTREDFPVFESAAILLYLEESFDLKKALSFHAPNSPKEYSTMIQWLFFGDGVLGAMQGQAHYFLHYSPQDVPVGKERYHEETRRLYGVLELGLSNRDWLAGPSRGKYTIADINAFPWVRLHSRAGIQTLDEWPNLKAWLERTLERQGVKTAIDSVAVGR